MSTDPTQSIERLMELLADRATDGLTAEESAELARLQAKWPHVDGEEFERAAAALVIAVEAEALPAALRANIAQDARQFFAVATPRTRVWKVAAALGWLATAACLAVALWSNRPGTAQTPSRAQLLADARTKQFSAAAAGEAVWNAELQAGVLTLKGLPANDPTKEQYQLWIFDRERDERYPVDGGVFDVTAGTVTVPIRAKLPVADPTLFAITVERPGGVVVSDRKRLVWAAK